MGPRSVRRLRSPASGSAASVGRRLDGGGRPDVTPVTVGAFRGGDKPAGGRPRFGRGTGPGSTRIRRPSHVATRCCAGAGNTAWRSVGVDPEVVEPGGGRHP